MGVGLSKNRNDDGKKNPFATEKLLVKGLIHEHLKTVAPSLAVEFQNTHLSCSETASEHLIRELQKKVLVIANMTGIHNVEDKSEEKQEQNNNRKQLGMKKNTYSDKEVMRIKRIKRTFGKWQRRWGELVGL